MSNTKIQPWQLSFRQHMPLHLKEAYTEARIRSWYEHWEGQVYVSFSGGKDSTVLLHQVRQLYPDVPAVFCDTGLEYPEIRDFVKTIENVVWMKPRTPFTQVLEKYGYPVISKKVARGLRDCQRVTEKNAATRHLRLTGFNRKGIFCPSQKLPKKWLRLIDSPYKFSDQCCDILKKEPFKRYVKETGRKPITAVMACESRMREQQYYQQGCNAYTSKTNPISMPMAFWRDTDVWEYLRKHKIMYSRIYDMGEVRTGCIFCAFGAHLEKSPNRFQRLAISHPQLHAYCMDKLGFRGVLDLIGVETGD